MELQKRRVTKADGRYILYYAFDQPFPEVYKDQTAGELTEPARPSSPKAEEESGSDLGKGGTARV